MALPTYHAGPVKPRKPRVPQGHGHNHTLTVRQPRRPRAARPKPDPLSLPAGPGSSYTVGQLRDLVNAAADQKFGGQQRALEARQTAIPAWFAAYRQQIAQAQQAQAQRTTDAVTALQGLAASAGAVGSAATPEAQAAARVREGAAGGQTQLAQLLGNNQGTFLQNLGLLTNVNQIAELGKAASALDEIGKQRADFGQTYGQQVLSDEAKQKLEAAAFGLNEAKASETIRHNKASERNTRRSTRNANRRANRQLDISQQNADANTYRAHHPRTSASGKDQFGNTKKDVQRNNDSWDKAKTSAKFYWSHGKKSFKGDWKQLADFLVTAKNLNPLYARAAAQRIVNGAVDAKLAKQLRRRGVKVRVANGSAQAQTITTTIKSGLENIGGN